MRPVHLVLIACGLLAGGAGGYLLASNHHAGGPRILFYQDPMHPAYRSSDPGIAPDCGMALVPVYATDVAGALGTATMDDNAGPAVDSSVQRLLGIRVSPVSAAGGQTRIHLFANLQADESRIFKLQFGTDGYVKETHGDAPGSHVMKDQRLATVYSPEFLSVVGGYLSANERTPGAQMMKDGAAANPGVATASARADRLRNLGMSDAQIEEISQTHKLPEDVYVVSPVDGYIVSRGISPGCDSIAMTHFIQSPI